MAINYTIVERRNLMDETAPVKFYALTKTSGEMTLRKLAKRISAISTISSGIIASLIANIIIIIVRFKKVKK